MIDYTPKLPVDVSSLFGNLSIASIALPTNIVWGLLLIIAIIVGLVTIVLYYHWIRYGMGDKGVILAQVLYTLVVLFSLGAMLSSIIAYGKIAA